MVIGIGGVSRSGKSTLAALIYQLFTEGGQTVVILSQDDYVFPTENIPKIKYGDEIEIDWETPESIDFQRYKTAILDARKQFDHVITEGLLSFCDASINRLIDSFFFVEISKNTFISRKAADKRWGKVPDWYIEHIWASYERLGRTILKDRNRKILELSGEREFDKTIVKTAIKNE